MFSLLISLAAVTATPAPAVDAATTPSPFASATPLAGSDLATVTGRADIAMEVRAQNTANVSSNSVTGQSQTGVISFDSQSFQNLNGLALLSANTGNNVAINSSLNVNVSVQR